MDVRLQPFDFEKVLARAGLSARGEPVAKTPATGSSQSFQTAMAQALRAASDTQLESDALAREVQLGNPTVSIEQAMVATVKSQVAFQSVVAVRNRLLQAYTEIMNMQV